jgi:hypothetical protein
MSVRFVASFLTARELLVMYRAIDEPKKQPELVSAGERKQHDIGQALCSPQPSECLNYGESLMNGGNMDDIAKMNGGNMDDTAKPKPVEKKPEAEQLKESELEKVTGGAVNAYLVIDGRPGPSTSKADAIKIVS